VENQTNPLDAVAAALEIKEFMDRTREERRNNGQQYWELRTGIHTGEVVAGVVGKMKFAYDIWGDAVNTASRMESSGEAGRVNISGSTYELVKDHFTCTYRGKVYAKNKGEIDMYFVEGRKG
jgi:class 3 adenylate cyclase